MSGFSYRSHPIASLLGGVALATIVVAGCSQGNGATTVPSAAAPSSATTQVMGKGMLHDVDGTASGEAQLVVKPDGTYEVVLESFKIDSLAHTNVVLVSNTDVGATGDIDKANLLDLGPLKSTEGMQDFPIPAAMASTVIEGYHTVVIWDTEMAHATAAAALK
jgi:hypothetical protein